MSLKKLTDLDKQEILRLYRETTETTTSLAKRFDVSTTTIVRWLRLQMSETEYESLVQQKRQGRTRRTGNQLKLALGATTPPPVILSLTKAALVEEEAREATPPPVILSLTKAALVEEEAREAAPPPVILSLTKAALVEEEAGEAAKVDVFALNEMLGEDLASLDEDDEELDETEDEDWDEGTDVTDRQSLAVVASVQVLPLSAAAFPKTCYLVIDRAAELIARPLKDFADLGKIPPAEVQQKTLPIFDSHRVARRFSNRFQRVIKVPDSNLLQKTSSHLRAKGITRILMDGHIYSLTPS